MEDASVARGAEGTPFAPSRRETETALGTYTQGDVKSMPEMPTTAPSSGAVGAIVSNGWLSGQSSFERKDERKMGRALVSSIAAHGAGLLLILFVMSIRPALKAVSPDIDKVKFVFIPEKGPGGGGGGSPAPAPKKPMEVPKHAMPTPVAPPVVVPPPPSLNAPVETPDANLLQAAGASSISLAAYGGGGHGTGIGSGNGSGIGPGSGGGFGGGAYHPGNGISDPVPIVSPEPKYTSDAMRNKIQGEVELQAVVKANGTVGDVKVTKSLDSEYGLDTEAIKAAKQWVFRPSKDPSGKAVDVIVTLVLTFRLH